MKRKVAMFGGMPRAKARRMEGRWWPKYYLKNGWLVADDGVRPHVWREGNRWALPPKFATLRAANRWMADEQIAGDVLPWEANR
jgi:hypothetical protein